MKDIKAWWRLKGASLVNSKLINLTGENIGFIPIENIIDEKFNEEEMRLLSQLLNEDGCSTREEIHRHKFYLFIK